MADWLKELRLLAKAEFHGRRVLATLATVALDGTPRARMVIVRDIFDDGSVVITTSAHSDKIAQLVRIPRAEMVFWFPHERQQFRLSGVVERIQEARLLQAQWEELGESGRSLFFGPPPGLPRAATQVFPQQVAKDAPPPASFSVLRLQPDQVETLDLNEHPHCRQRWYASQAAGGWTMQEITP